MLTTFGWPKQSDINSKLFLKKEVFFLHGCLCFDNALKKAANSNARFPNGQTHTKKGQVDKVVSKSNSCVCVFKHSSNQ